VLLATLLLAAGSARAAVPDPMARGSYAVTTMDPFTAGTVNLQEPAAGGGAATGPAAAVTLQLRGSLYAPIGRTTPSPVLVLVHGNHGSCDTGSAPDCTAFKRNDRGYAYLGENLASWGYTVVSLDQDQLMYYQDSPMAKGMHQRRLLIAAALDALYKANQEPLGPDSTIGGSLVGKLDMTRIGLMGHSRGGDAVTSFIDYNRTRPEPGRRYPLRGVIALAPVDYERRAPYGTPFMAELPLCDGDVSNLQGARFFERSQYVAPGDPFPRVQIGVHGTNHNWFNSVWAADGEDSNPNDAACSVTQPNNIRLSGGTSTYDSSISPATDSGASGGGTYTFVNRGSGDPALMGDQEKVGLATMSAFFRRYVGGESGFDAYMTGERNAEGLPELPESACPSQQISGVSRTGQAGQTNGLRIPCAERTLTSYFAAPAEREDVIRPEPDDPLGLSAVGTALTGSGFANPYLDTGGVLPKPATTSGGYDWCNPEPDHFAPGQLGKPGYPAATKACPLPAIGDLGGQTGIRENGPVNQSYGLQLALAWENPLAATGKPATIGTRIPAAKGDVSGLKALALGAAVNFFDPRNPAHAGEALWNPAATMQDFTIALTDAAGRTGTVAAADQRYGNALHPSVGDTTSKTHVILNQIRVPLADFAAQGVDLKQVRRIELRFGEEGKPATGSVQIADVRFQEAAAGPQVLADVPGGPGPATGRSTSGPDPVAILAATPRAQPSAREPDVLGLAGATKVGSPTRCVDRTAPSVRVTRATVAGRRLTVRGRAADSGCRRSGKRAARKGSVASVQVSLAKATGKRCRFVGADGRLGRSMGCGAPVALVAKGRSSWSLRTVRRLAAGRYRLVVRAIDADGNQRRTAVRTVVVR
jgi:hypothetical protein